MMTVKRDFRGTFRKEGASVIFAFSPHESIFRGDPKRRVILLRSDIMLCIVILSFGQFKGEYNITETARFQYHFCRKAKISLWDLSHNITIKILVYILWDRYNFKVYNPLWHFHLSKVSFFITKHGRQLLYEVSPVGWFFSFLSADSLGGYCQSINHFIAVC